MGKANITCRNERVKKMFIGAVIPKEDTEKLGWFNVIFPNGTKDPNCIIEMPDGVKYGCNEFADGYEIRFEIHDNYKLEKIEPE